MLKKLVFFLFSFVMCLGMSPSFVSAKELGGYERYQKAVRVTVGAGSWTENLVMKANMTISYDNAEVKTKVTANSLANVSNYTEHDLSGIQINGSGKLNFMAQSYVWDVKYKDGVAHYQYTEPDQRSAEVEMDPGYFNFYTLKQDMLSNVKVSRNKITFTIPGNKMENAKIAAVNMIDGIDDLHYGDVSVKVTINKDTGGIDAINMDFHASLNYQGYDAESDYVINYQFAASGSDLSDSNWSEKSIFNTVAMEVKNSLSMLMGDYTWVFVVIVGVAITAIIIVVVVSMAGKKRRKRYLHQNLKIICPNCGKENNETAKFCGGCGQSIVDGQLSDAKAVPKKRKSRLPIVIGLFIFGVLLAIGVITVIFFCLENKNTDGTENNEKNLVESVTTEEEEPEQTDRSKEQNSASSQPIMASEPEEEATIATPEQVQMAGIDPDNVGDYNKCLDKARYKIVKLDTGFSFVYPPDFFSEVEQDGNNYTFSAADGDVTYDVNEYVGSGDALNDVAQYYDSVNYDVDDEESNPLTGFRNISDEVKDGWAHAIVSGRFLDDQSRGMYFLVASDGENVYTMKIQYTVMGSDDDYETPQNYMIDCLYRGFAHSGTSYKIRSYKQFKKGDMGEKK